MFTSNQHKYITGSWCTNTIHKHNVSKFRSVPVRWVRTDGISSRNPLIRESGIYMQTMYENLCIIQIFFRLWCSNTCRRTNKHRKNHKTLKKSPVFLDSLISDTGQIGDKPHRWQLDRWHIKSVTSQFGDNITRWQVISVTEFNSNAKCSHKPIVYGSSAVPGTFRWRLLETTR